MYDIKYAPHKKTIQRETDNNITEDTDMWIKRDNNGKNTFPCKRGDVKQT